MFTAEKSYPYLKVLLFTKGQFNPKVVCQIASCLHFSVNKFSDSLGVGVNFGWAKIRASQVPLKENVIKPGLTYFPFTICPGIAEPPFPVPFIMGTFSTLYAFLAHFLRSSSYLLLQGSHHSILSLLPFLNTHGLSATPFLTSLAQSLILTIFIPNIPPQSS